MGKNHKRLSIEERTMIQTQLSMGCQPGQIAQELGRCAGTLSRELKRNGWSRPKLPRGVGRPLLSGGCRADVAQSRANACTVEPRIPRKLKPVSALRKQATKYLKVGYSPVQIAGTLATVHPDTPTFQASHETICTAICAMPRDGTLVERATLCTVLAKMEDASAVSAVNGFGDVLNRIEAQKRLSMTYDQGREMAGHQQMTAETGIRVYFADPHSPWQRGISKNTKGFLRQYLPKGSDLRVFSQKELDAIALKSNTRPRKSLGFKCPAQLFTPDAFDFRQHHAAVFALGA